MNASSANDHPVTILVVDDDDVVRLLAQESLADAGYSVATAADGEQALERVEELRPDLVLLDVNMPRMDGFTTCRELRKTELGLHLPVLIATCLGRTPDEIKHLTQDHTQRQRQQQNEISMHDSRPFLFVTNNSLP